MQSGGTTDKPRVLLDVDGVLADFVGSYLDLLASELGILASREQVIAFDIGASLGLTREQSSQMKRALGNKAQFARWLEVYPGAVEGVARLQDVADVYIVTSPWNSNPTWTFDREQWLREHFNIHHSRVVHTSAKHLCRGDFLVDDKTDTLRSWVRENPYGIAVQWKTPHNRQDGWLSRATDSWGELVAFVSAHGRLRHVEAGLAELRDSAPELPPAPDFGFDLGGEG